MAAAPEAPSPPASADGTTTPGEEVDELTEGADEDSDAVLDTLVGRWVRIGGRGGAADSDPGDLFSNELFRQEREGDLYEDLSDVEISVSVDPTDRTEIELSAASRRQIASDHEVLATGAVLGPEHASAYRALNEQTTRLEVRYDYVPDLFGEVDFGVELDAGYRLSELVAVAPRPLPDEPTDNLGRPSLGERLAQWRRDHRVRFDRGMLRDAGSAFLDLIQALSSSLGEGLVDTEQGAVFFEGYVEPLSLFVDLGVPVDAELFFPGEDGLEVGDAVSYLVFLGANPVTGGFRESGVQSSASLYHRLQRETVVEKLPDGFVRVAVRTSVASGAQRIPLRFRPEVRLLILELGYTLFESRSNDYWFQVADLVYRIDVGQAAGREALRHLLGQGHRLQTRPVLEAAVAGEAVWLEAAELRRGDREDDRLSLRIPGIYRYRSRSFELAQDVWFEGLRFHEAASGHSRRVRRRAGRDREEYHASVIQLRGQPTVDRNAVLDPEEADAVFQTVLENRHATPEDLRQLIHTLESILGLTPNHPLLTHLEEVAARGDDSHGLEVVLTLHLGPEELARVRSVDTETLWRALAARLLGPVYEDAWSTPERRRWWGPRTYRPQDGLPRRHISEHYDDHRRRHDRVARPPGMTDQAAAQSRWLFLRAERLAERFAAWMGAAEDDAPCVGCVVATLTSLEDAAIVQSLFVELAGGVAAGCVDYRLEVFDDTMAEPWVEAVAPGRGMGAAGSVAMDDLGALRVVIPDLERARDAERRLRSVDIEARLGVGEPALRLLLHTNLVLDEALDLRFELRTSRIFADRALAVGRFDPGEPIPVPESPFRAGRYLYEVQLPWIPDLADGENFTADVRLVGPEGLPVTEQVLVRFRLPRELRRLARRELGADDAEGTGGRAGERAGDGTAAPGPVWIDEGWAAAPWRPVALETGGPDGTPPASGPPEKNPPETTPDGPGG